MLDLYAEFKALILAFNAEGVPYAVGGGLVFAGGAVRIRRLWKPQEQGGDVLTVELRRLCLSLREAMNREKEATLLVDFERSLLDANGSVPTDVRVLRAGFKEMWRRGEYARILAVAHRLPCEMVEGDETILMYFTCASQCLSAGSAAVGVGR